MGKNLGDDFKLGKTTLPIILAWEKSNLSERKFWVRTIRELKQESSDFDKALTILNKYDIFSKCKDKAQEFILIARNALHELPNTKFKEYFVGLADESIERSK
jgi:octaprenyl-diphosphate synthase